MKLWWLKFKFKRNYLKYLKVLDRYSCGEELVLDISHEAYNLKVTLDEVFNQLKELDPECPESW